MSWEAFGLGWSGKLMGSEGVEMSRGKWPQGPWLATEMKLWGMSTVVFELSAMGEENSTSPLILGKEGG